MRLSRLLLFLLLYLPSPPSFAQTADGFIVTLDQKLIEGKVVEIYYADWKTELIFENTFGRIYQFYPFRIGGFLHIKNQDTIVYESKYTEGQWLFLQQIHKAEALSLYASPERKWAMVRGINGMEQVHLPVREYWLEFRKKRPFRVYPMTYKKELKRRFSKFPELVEKIGEPGYRFKDMEKIVQEYNLYMTLNQRRI